MGNVISNLVNSCEVRNNICGLVSRKRKREDSEIECQRNELERVLRTPKRMKLISTKQYIYQNLFVEGHGSDVTVEALDRCWKLHKVYLSQSPYFNSMFSGSWRESTESVIKIKIVNPKVNEDALTTVFGSLYMDDTVLEPTNIVAVLATATLFQLDGLIDNCVSLMIDTINIMTVIDYYESAMEYNLTQLQKATLNWLLVNMLPRVQRDFKTLKNISPELMTKIVTNPNLIVIQSEYSVYSMLRTWIQLQLQPQSENYTLTLMPQSFDEEGTPLLLTEKGKPYAAPFKALRFQHMLTHHRDMEVVEREKIVPQEWLLPCKIKNWDSMIYVYAGVDKGPRTQDITAEEFEMNCIRCGRELQVPSEFMWRWTGFNFGMQLVWHFHGNELKVRRVRTSDPEMPHQQHRRMLYRASLVSYDKFGMPVHFQTTNIKTVTFLQNEEVSLLTVENQLTYPILLSMKIMFTTPLQIQNRIHREVVAQEVPAR